MVLTESEFWSLTSLVFLCKSSIVDTVKIRRAALRASHLKIFTIHDV